MVRRSAWGLASAVAFLLVLAPWFARNIATFGAPLPSAGGHTLWIRSYNEQFSIGHEVSLASYLDWGAGNIIGSKLESWGELVGRTAVLMGGTFLIFFVVGLWLFRRRAELAPFFVYFVVMFVAMGAALHVPRTEGRLLPLGAGVAAMGASAVASPPSRRC